MQVQVHADGALWHVFGAADASDMRVHLVWCGCDARTPWPHTHRCADCGARVGPHTGLGEFCTDCLLANTQAGRIDSAA